MSPSSLERLQSSLAGRGDATALGWTGDPRQAMEIRCAASVLPELAALAFRDWGFAFAGLVVDDPGSALELRYLFASETDSAFLHFVPAVPPGSRSVPSIVQGVHAADWHEREAFELHGIDFPGHPRLGNFVRHGDDAASQRVVRETGAFAIPIGPKFSGVTEPSLVLLETVGEDVLRSLPRLYYKWRAVEHSAVGRDADQALLLAERFSATSAFAHGLAYCQAVESICGTRISRRAAALRVFLAELERIRQHAGAIADICESTALAVAASGAAAIEEDLLRISGELTGHRYLFGLLALGGLLRDLSDAGCRTATARAVAVVAELDRLEKHLRVSSSFLDRLEEVGAIAAAGARDCGLVGPLARASGYACDLRRTHSYSGYEAMAFEVPREAEGDGYARLRLLFAEARQSARILRQAADELKPEEVRTPWVPRAGAALGWVEAPRGAAYHWVRLDAGGRIARYHVCPPSFSNWLGLHAAVENFAFQDFPIILATLDLSAGESDR